MGGIKQDAVLQNGVLAEPMGFFFRGIIWAEEGILASGSVAGGIEGRDGTFQIFQELVLTRQGQTGGI